MDLKNLVHGLVEASQQQLYESRRIMNFSRSLACSVTMQVDRKKRKVCFKHMKGSQLARRKSYGSKGVN